MYANDTDHLKVISSPGLSVIRITIREYSVHSVYSVLLNVRLFYLIKKHCLSHYT